MTGAEVVIEGLRACGLHIDGYTAGDLVDISDAVLAALEAAGFVVAKPDRYEYTLGWYAETQKWCTLGTGSHPWLSEMQRQLHDHDGDSDWDGVAVIGRPVFAWTESPAVSGDEK